MTTNPEQASQEAVDTATAHAEAVEFARKAQIERADSDIHSKLEEISQWQKDHQVYDLHMHQDALDKISAIPTREDLGKIVKDALSVEDTTSSPRYVNISRVPLICQAIIGIDKRLTGIETNLVWGVRIIIGAVLLAILKLVFIP